VPELVVLRKSQNLLASGKTISKMQRFIIDLVLLEFALYYPKKAVQLLEEFLRDLCGGTGLVALVVF